MFDDIGAAAIGPGRPRPGAKPGVVGLGGLIGAGLRAALGATLVAVVVATISLAIIALLVATIIALRAGRAERRGKFSPEGISLEGARLARDSNC